MEKELKMTSSKSKAPALNNAPLTVWEHIDFQGESREFFNSEPWVDWPWNDRISSIRLGDRYKAILYEDRDYSGNYFTTLFGPLEFNLNGLHIHDKVSSIEIVHLR